MIETLFSHGSSKRSGDAAWPPLYSLLSHSTPASVFISMRFRPIKADRLVSARER